jgi:uncharacterized protein YjiS (DUF1127 family)
MKLHTAQSLLEVHKLADARPAKRLHPGIVARIVGGLTTAAMAFSKKHRYRKDIKDLRRMDDRMLADIGLTRGEIELSVWHGRL